MRELLVRCFQKMEDLSKWERFILHCWFSANTRFHKEYVQTIMCLLHYTQELRIRIKYARNLSFFCIDVQQTFSFPCWNIINCLNELLFSSSCNSFIMLQKLVWCKQCGRGQHMRWSVISDNIKTTVVDKLNYRGTQS